MIPLQTVREALGLNAWWSVTEGREGATWTVGDEGADGFCVRVLGHGATLEEAIADAKNGYRPDAVRGRGRMRIVR